MWGNGPGHDLKACRWKESQWCKDNSLCWWQMHCHQRSDWPIKQGENSCDQGHWGFFGQRFGWNQRSTWEGLQWKRRKNWKHSWWVLGRIREDATRIHWAFLKILRLRVRFLQNVERCPEESQERDSWWQERSRRDVRKHFSLDWKDLRQSYGNRSIVIILFIQTIIKLSFNKVHEYIVQARLVDNPI